MAKARTETVDKLAWNRTQAIVAQLYNAFSDPKSPGYKPVDPMTFCPYVVKGEKRKPGRAPPPTPEQRESLRRLFPRKQ